MIDTTEFDDALGSLSGGESGTQVAGIEARLKCRGPVEDGLVMVSATATSNGITDGGDASRVGGEGLIVTGTVFQEFGVVEWVESDTVSLEHLGVSSAGGTSAGVVTDVGAKPNTGSSDLLWCGAGGAGGGVVGRGVVAGEAVDGLGVGEETTMVGVSKEVGLRGSGDDLGVGGASVEAGKVVFDVDPGADGYGQGDSLGIIGGEDHRGV